MLSKLKDNNVIECTEKEIHGELQRILSSDLFSRSTVLSNFLKFIVEETLEGRTEELKEYTIAVSALGKSTDFNPQIDAIVRIHAGRLRRSLHEYYSGIGNSNPIKIEVVKGTYVPVFRNHLTNKLNKTGEEKLQPNVYSRSKLTLAILPFRNLCPDNDYQFFTDGFGEELTRIFSTFQDIDVIAHHSTRKYASEPEDVRIIGSEMGIHYLISGSVKRTAEEIIVSLGLIETLNGIQVWSQTYNYELNSENLIMIQDEIIENVCSILGGYYGIIIHKNYKTNCKTLLSIESFDAALWNYYLHMNFSQETYLHTRNALEKALKNDPDFALGMAMLSEIYLDSYALGYPTIEKPVTVAYDLCIKALKLDPQCQHAHQQFAWANIYLKRKAEAIQAMDHCLSLNPSSVSSRGAIGFGMACVGEYNRAYALLSQSIELNPHCPWWFYLGFFLYYYNDKQYEKALICANKIEVPDVFFDPLTKATAKWQLGMTKEALSDVGTLREKFPNIMDNLKMYLNMFLLDTSIINEIIESIKELTVGKD